MPPMSSRRRKLKGTHCFEMSVPRFLSNHAPCSLDLRCNSLAVGQDASPAPFHADPHQRMVTLLITAAPNPTGAHGHSRRAHCEMHARASALLAWTRMHPAPPDSCVVVPWSAWGPGTARVVTPRLDDTTQCASKSKFLGSGMRVITPRSSRSDGTSVVTVTDYHPSRVFRGLRAEKRVQSIFAHADPERDNISQGPILNLRSRSKSLPLPTVRTLPPLPTLLNLISITTLPVYQQC
jgi:hypothetical protein